MGPDLKEQLIWLKSGQRLIMKHPRRGVLTIFPSKLNIREFERMIVEKVPESQIWSELSVSDKVSEVVIYNPCTVEDIEAVLKVVGDKFSHGWDPQMIINMLSRDMLCEIFKRNSEFTRFCIANNPRAQEMQMDEETFRLRLTLAMLKELGEYVDNIPWKWWGRGVWEVQKKAAGEELIDLLHFLLTAFEELGWTPEMIYREYIEKNDRNWERFSEREGWKQNVEGIGSVEMVLKLLEQGKEVVKRSRKGVMVIRPTKKNLKELKKIIRSGDFSEVQIWEILGEEKNGEV